MQAFDDLFKAWQDYKGWLRKAIWDGQGRFETRIHKGFPHLARLLEANAEEAVRSKC